MKHFDVVITNPPFNSADKTKGSAGTTGGDTILYRKFINKAFQLVKDDGIVAMVVIRQGIIHAMMRYGVSCYNPDTSRHWDYAAGWFITINGNDDADNWSPDPIIRKTYSLVGGRTHYNVSGSYESNRHRTFDKAVPGSVPCLVETATKDAPARVANVIGNMIPAGPKLLYKKLETRLSYTATDFPHIVEYTHTIFYDTMAEANAALKFVLNNPIIRYLNKRLNEKADGTVFRFLKPFDLKQIVTGKEYPVEWELTPQEIERIEHDVG